MFKKLISSILVLSMIIVPANMTFCYAAEPTQLQETQEIQKLKNDLINLSKKSEVNEENLQTVKKDLTEISRNNKISKEEIDSIKKSLANIESSIKSNKKTTKSFSRQLLSVIFDGICASAIIAAIMAVFASIPVTIDAVHACKDDNRCSFVNLKNKNNVFSKFKMAKVGENFDDIITYLSNFLLQLTYSTVHIVVM